MPRYTVAPGAGVAAAALGAAACAAKVVAGARVATGPRSARNCAVSSGRPPLAAIAAACRSKLGGAGGGGRCVTTGRSIAVAGGERTRFSDSAPTTLARSGAMPGARAAKFAD